MPIKKKRISPRQKMINLMYVVMMAMLALNVSSDVLNGFSLVEESLNRTTENATSTNQSIYTNFEAQMKANPTKVKAWYDKALYVRGISDSLFNLAEELKVAIVKKSDGLVRYEERNKYVHHRVSQIKYSEFHNLYEYLEGRTPFSTQHKTKGTEFKDVFVILDNGKWNNYNFEKLFTVDHEGQDRVTERTKKIFYVCCTRAMEQLAVYYDLPSAAVITKAEEWFGRDNMIRLPE